MRPIPSNKAVTKAAKPPLGALSDILAPQKSTALTTGSETRTLFRIKLRTFMCRFSIIREYRTRN
jgi:hypothetical protein